MPNKKFPGDLKPITQLQNNQKEFLIEHYKRCESFWRHWTPTIWSIPSVASAINVGAYSLIFNSSRNIESNIKVIILGILFFLNLALTLGIWKHRYLQKVFGDRILDIEKYAQIPTISFKWIHSNLSGSLFYVIVMLIILFVSFFFLIFEISAS